MSRKLMCILLVLLLLAGSGAGGYLIGHKVGVREGQTTGGPSAYYPSGYNDRHFDLPTVFAPCYATAAQIDTYWSVTAPAYKGTGAAIVKVCKQYGLDPSFVVALMRHEGGNGNGPHCDNGECNCFSWGISDSNPTITYYHTFSNCILQVIPQFYRLYLAKGAVYGHGSALLGIAVRYVGGSGKTAWGVVGWTGSTTTATATELYLLGDSSYRCTVLANSSIKFSVDIIARDDTNNASKAWEIRGLIQRDGSSNTSLVGPVTKTTIADSGVGWDVTVDADDTNDALRVTVTGAASTTIRWFARGELTEVRA